LDEVLSVGDGAFRAKSEAKMREIIKGGATTILVSHSIKQIRLMCNKVLWLNKGRQIAFSDNVQGVCDAYEEFLCLPSRTPAKSNSAAIVTELSRLRAEAAKLAEVRRILKGVGK
jgi:ABC-type sulfate/molybdate transport systems ATPase subunit